MLHVLVAFFPQCHMSNIKKGDVPCHYRRMSLSPMSHVKFRKCQCRRVYFRGLGPLICVTVRDVTGGNASLALDEGTHLPQTLQVYKRVQG